VPSEDLQNKRHSDIRRGTADYRLRAIMGLAELLEGCAGLGPAEERFYVLVVGEAERGGAVTLGVFAPTVFRGQRLIDDLRKKLL
jgi:hypothetical protein